MISKCELDPCLDFYKALSGVQTQRIDACFVLSNASRAIFKHLFQCQVMLSVTLMLCFNSTVQIKQLDMIRGRHNEVNCLVTYYGH